MALRELSGRVAVITGAGSGLGASLAKRCSAAGMSVLVTDIDETSAQAVATALRDTGADSIAHRVDVSDPDSVEQLAALAYARWGDVGLLVNNAGVELHGRLWEFTVEQWRRVIDVDLNGVYYGMRAFIPRMLAAERSAAIVNVASIAGLYTKPHTAAYGTAKHGVVALSETANHELAEVSDLVSVSVAIPAGVQTGIFEKADAAGAVGEQHRADLAGRLREGGISADSAAELILDGLRAGRSHIHTDPQRSREEIDQRWSLLQASTQTDQ